MASRAIEYIWKVARPKDESIARAIMYAAYQTAIATDPNPTQVLIRSYIHHLTSHGYTPHLNSCNVIRVAPASKVLKDEESNAWPVQETAMKPRETVAGPPGLLGPKESYITWPSEETGEEE